MGLGGARARPCGCRGIPGLPRAADFGPRDLVALAVLRAWLCDCRGRRSADLGGAASPRPRDAKSLHPGRAARSRGGGAGSGRRGCGLCSPATLRRATPRAFSGASSPGLSRSAPCSKTQEGPVPDSGMGFLSLCNLDADLSCKLAIRIQSNFSGIPSARWPAPIAASAGPRRGSSRPTAAHWIPISPSFTMYERWMDGLERNPPGPDWNGDFVAQTK